MSAVPLLANPRARAMLSHPGGAGAVADALGIDAGEVIGDLEGWRALAGTAEAVAVAGGDGTLRQAVQCLGPGARVVPVPMGHGNDLCRRLGIEPWDLEGARRRLEEPRWRQVDLWVARDRRGRAHRFVNSLGVGLDAAVNRRRARTPKWVGYVPLFLLTLASLERVRLEVLWDSGGWTGSTYWLGLMNSGLTGGGLALSPDADPADGLLDLFAVLPQGRAGLLRLLPKVQRGERLEGDTVRARAARFEVHGPRECDLAVDGDLLAASPPLVVEREGTVFLAA